MAPEQHRGDSVGPLADQFGFCVALYEGLYGERPFAGNSVASLALNVLDGQVRGAPRDTKIPTWLREVVLRGLQVDPSDRYPSMDALLADLQRDPPKARRVTLMASLACVALAALGVARYGTQHTSNAHCEQATAQLAGHWDDSRRRAIRDALLDSS